jgi:hypothetical protein
MTFLGAIKQPQRLITSQRRRYAARVLTGLTLLGPLRSTRHLVDDGRYRTANYRTIHGYVAINKDEDVGCVKQSANEVPAHN